jgi:hypothetical protein
MKNIILLVLMVLIIISCKKEESDEPINNPVDSVIVTKKYDIVINYYTFDMKRSPNTFPIKSVSENDTIKMRGINVFICVKWNNDSTLSDKRFTDREMFRININKYTKRFEVKLTK